MRRVEDIFFFKYAKAAQKNGYLYPGVAYGFPKTRDPLHPKEILDDFFNYIYIYIVKEIY
jgi:hypothetical protein